MKDLNRTIIIILCICVFVFLLFGLYKRWKDKYYLTNLYEKREPIQTHSIEVDGGHRIHVSEYGNKRGVPLVMFHGGPGGSLDDEASRFCDPDKYHVVMIDQRGSGRSEPKGATYKNTTEELLKDVEYVRKMLNIEKWIVFGGSWGATLALVYGMRHPSRVKGMILRGTFLNREEDYAWLFSARRSGGMNPGMFRYMADTVDAYTGYNSGGCMSSMNVYKKSDLNEELRMYNALLRCLNGEYGEKAKKECSHVKTLYEYSLSSGVMKSLLDMVILGKIQSERDWETETKTETDAQHKVDIWTHYSIHRMFLEEDAFTKEKLKVLGNIPIILIHGRYDYICNMENSKYLFDVLPRSYLILTDGGHSMYDAENIKYLVYATDIIV